jgi:beta-N-acetylhexosaminidase
LWHDEARLRQVEFPPFVAAVRAGARMMMTAHVALPHLNGGSELPATLSAPILQGLLRQEMGFEGVIVSDALDMHAIEQGPALIVESLAALLAGVDMLMLTTYTDQAGVYSGLAQAAHRGLLPAADLLASAMRVLALKDWASRQVQPSLDVVACAEHRALADEIANQSITLVRDAAGTLPLRLTPDQRLAVIVPEPKDLTPADTSSHDRLALAEILRRRHPRVDELRLPLQPRESDITAVLAQVDAYDAVIVGTINVAAHPEQAVLVNALLRQGHPTIAVALRMPYDLAAYPTAPTYLCTYSLQPPSLEALVRVLWGDQPAVGQLPVTLPF